MSIILTIYVTLDHLTKTKINHPNYICNIIKTIVNLLNYVCSIIKTNVNHPNYICSIRSFYKN
jgi:hypothetical protein